MQIIIWFSFSIFFVFWFISFLQRLQSEFMVYTQRSDAGLANIALNRYGNVIPCLRLSGFCFFMFCFLQGTLIVSCYLAYRTITSMHQNLKRMAGTSFLRNLLCQRRSRPSGQWSIKKKWQRLLNSASQHKTQMYTSSFVDFFGYISLFIFFLFLSVLA